MAGSQTGTKKKVLKRTAKKPPQPVEQIDPDYGRPFRVAFDVFFVEGGRKVYPKHLREAMAAGEAAIRARLESFDPSYEVAEIVPEATYEYTQWHSSWDE
jgi:hypothetical protein